MREGLPAADLRRGTDQAGVRLYNERLVLSLIRRGGGLPKAEIARLTGLSPQTTTVIMNRLEQEGLIRRGEPQRGRIGQPAIPYMLNPDGAVSFGLKIGRRSTDLVVVDFLGRVIARRHWTHPYPLPDSLLAHVREGTADLTARLSETQRARIVGFGVATPFELWNWEPEVGAPPAVMQAWRGFDARQALTAVLPWPVHVMNDGTAACAAENLFGNAQAARDFVYVFVGSFVGGGIVVSGNVVPGRTGNAGAIGSMPVPRAAPGGKVVTEQLIRAASLYVLEDRLRAAGVDASDLWREPRSWPDYGAHLDAWLEEAGRALAVLVAGATAILDFEAVILDGAFPPEIRRRLAEATRAGLELIDRQGLTPCEIREGSVGADARAIGAAALPILANFARNREVLFKEAADAQRD
ncbi:ROK family transcriptional regulator [Prosthecomicrobium sp. N25]|uniref:ROK family transcriptional regulator n=1 Tax=Prosthecomicrobium sp. N25 TaxID=3129254 RepID=UPI003FCD32DA